MVYIFDSHPVQYKAPVYQQLEKLAPGRFEVIYATDCSVRGHVDREFGQFVAWNTPLLQGYTFRVLNNERGNPLQGFRTLTGRGVFALLRKERPQAVVLCQFLYEFDLVVYASCLLLGIPLWIRQETQDEARAHTGWKSCVRSFVYRLIYRQVEGAFYLGKLNRDHFLRHGFRPDQLILTPFCTADAPALDQSEKQRRRDALRNRLKIPPEATLVIFSGKFIEKKNPQLVLQSFGLLPDALRSRLHVLFIGGGELEPTLRELARPFTDQIHFGGLINQAEIFDYYLAADLLMLPSLRQGETWGLVVNEALQAGCGVVITHAVGAYAEFGDWERVRVIPIGDAAAGARALAELAAFPRDFDWCTSAMKRYSVMAAAVGLAEKINQLAPAPQLPS